MICIYHPNCADGLRGDLAWYVFRSKPFSEGRAERELTKQRFEVFIPLSRRTVVRRGVSTEIITPLFWTYGFIKFDPVEDRWQSIYSTRGVVGLIGPSVGEGPPRAIPDAEMDLLKERILQEGGTVPLDAAPPRIGEGSFVRIIYGPFQGHVGKVSSDEGAWVDVLLRFVGAVRPLPFSKGFVEVV